MNPKDFIGLDVGEVRTGLARASALARLAEPLKTVPTGEALGELKKLADQGVSGIVVGLPRGIDGQETEQTAWVRQWVDETKKLVEATFYWQDEALTSKLAEAEALKSGKIKEADSLAAQIILQDFLDSPENMRVVC